MKRKLLQKNTLYFILTTLSLLSCSNDIDNPDNLDSKYVFIPDNSFEEILIEQNIDSDNTVDGKILRSDAEKVYTLDLNKEQHFGNIKNLTGIEGFKNITKLTAVSHEITSIDLSHNQLLDTLYLIGNYLKEINFTQNPNLIYIDIQSNELEIIKGLSSATKLKKLNASWNNLETFNIQNPSLEVLHISQNFLTELNINEATNLKNLLLTSNKLASLNISSNHKLETLLTSDNRIESINLENNRNLTHLYITSNNLNRLDVSNNLKLIELKVDRNPNLTCIKKLSNQNIPSISLSTYQTISSNCN
ncbi:leucine-rich repeat domain-containing protein [Wenyingzhuangia marina]|uniref:Leucine Rich repeat-containing protein n=1 Tax=Wenyingzhuangia marina TaxID=1195760 RepID=A0A1M5SFY8_9FLAO|nr:hypothetical protein [Wenyingzhuangia marina]GGF61881.1 hypothetical protein GCM10011397_01240 [Wenyingzhuangia marina]SHH36803.1 hypothetical protein SAMN05444281_0263 [Wenyingzhuangia marina]